MVDGGLETRKRGVGAGEIRSRITVKRSSHDVMGFGDAREAVAAKRHLARTHPDQAASARKSKHRTTMKRYCDTRADCILQGSVRSMDSEIQLRIYTQWYRGRSPTRSKPIVHQRRQRNLTRFRAHHVRVLDGYIERNVIVAGMSKVTERLRRAPG